MNKNITDFFSLYQEGKIKDALCTLYKNVDINYENIEANNLLMKYLFNYLDAMTSSDLYAAISTNQHLIKFLKKLGNVPTRILECLQLDALMLSLRSFSIEAFEELFKNYTLPHFSKNIARILFAEKHFGSMTNEVFHNLVSQYPDSLKNILYEQFRFSKNYQTFQFKKSDLFNRLKNPIRPHWPFSFPDKDNYRYVSKQLSCIQGKVPMIVMENIDMNWDLLLRPYQSKKVVFLFHNINVFLQCLQFDAVFKSLLDNKHIIFIFGIYPNELYECQPEVKLLKEHLEIVLCSKSSILKYDKNRLIEAIYESIDLWHKEKLETTASNYLYRIGKEIRDCILLERYGTSRHFTIRINRDFDERYDKYKGICKEIDTHIKFTDYEGRELDKHIPIAQKRYLSSNRKLRLAHVVSKFADGNNSAPSRVLRTLMKYHNKEYYDLFVISHEQHIIRYTEYPLVKYEARPTQKAAEKTIKEFEEMGIDIYIDKDLQDFVTTARSISENMKQKEIDIAIFHQLPPINALIARMCDVPYRVFLDHGTSFPMHKGFDLIIVSNLDSGYNVNKEFYESLGSSIVDLPMIAECRDSWDKKPYPKAYFYLPEDAQILTTASNYLEQRLSPDACWAISEILKQCPDAYYLPIGPISSTKLKETFHQLGVGQQVIFLGNQKSPSQLIRSMDLYLNEFPFGGSIGVMDAMASGTPVVTMYYQEGAPQGRYAGLYMGKEYSITSCKKEDYVELACQLLKNRKMYQKWSDHTLKQYEKRINPQKYVQRLENILLNHISLK